MKTKILISAMSLLAVFSFANCEGKEDMNSAIIISNTNYSTCLNELSLSEYIKYNAINDSTLRFEYKFIANCAMENCTVKLMGNREEIIINVEDYGSDANCICPIILNYDIVNLKRNKIYHFLLKHNSQDLYSSEIAFTVNAKDSITLNQ